MENKTISYLNSKMWYRFLKVIFILLFFITATIVCFVTFSTTSSSNRFLDKGNSRIICKIGNKGPFLIKGILNNSEIKLISNNVSDYSSVFDNSLNLDNDISKKISQACVTPLDPTKKTYSIDELVAAGATTANNPFPGLFRIESVYNNNTKRAIIYALTSLIITTLIFGLIKRSFYYIILGTIKPKK